MPAVRDAMPNPENDSRIASAEIPEAVATVSKWTDVGVPSELLSKAAELTRRLPVLSSATIQSGWILLQRIASLLIVESSGYWFGIILSS